jgi:hypothetical protein
VLLVSVVPASLQETKKQSIAVAVEKRNFFSLIDFDKI